MEQITLVKHMLAWWLPPFLCQAFTHFIHLFGDMDFLCSMTLPFFISWAAKLHVKNVIDQVNDFLLLHNNYLSSEGRFHLALEAKGLRHLKRLSRSVKMNEQKILC